MAASQVTTNLMVTNESDTSYEEFMRSVCEVRINYVTRMVFFALFALIGMLGNVTLLATILSNRCLQNRPNILISNLAVSDLLYILVTCPIRIANEIHPCWLLGDITCAIRNYLPVVCQCACVYSLVALIRERYCAIIGGFHSRTLHKVKLTYSWIFAIWLFGIIFASPILSQAFSYLDMGVLCMYSEHGSQSAQIYEIFRLVMLYINPIIIISVHYSLMAKTLMKSTREFNQKNNVSFGKQFESRKKLAYLSLTISLFFALFWLPSHVYTIMYQFMPAATLQKMDEIIKFRHLHYYMALANSSINPWLIFVLSSTHRNCLLWRFGYKKSVAKDSMRGTTRFMIKNTASVRACGSPEGNCGSEHRILAKGDTLEHVELDKFVGET